MRTSLSYSAAVALVLPLTALLLCACATREELRVRPASVHVPPGGAALPVQWCTDLVLAEVRIDGEGPYVFVLDTGASVCALDDDVAERFVDRRLDAALDAVGADGEEQPVRSVVRSRRITSGEWAATDVDLVVVDLGDLAAVMRTPVHGILGYGAFGGALLTLDYAAHSASVAHGALPEPDGATVLRVSDKGGVPGVVIEMAGSLHTVVVDTGSGGCIQLPDWPPDVPFAASPRPTVRRVTLAGLAERRTHLARVGAEARLGARAVTDPLVARSSGVARIGGRFLQGARITFDADRGLLSIDTGRRRADPYVGTGLVLFADGDRWLVRDVMPGSGAEEAGLLAGDHVLAIDGVSVTEIDVRVPRPPAAAIPRQRVLTIERDGRARDVPCVVRALVP